jgi:hypothetical protein
MPQKAREGAGSSLGIGNATDGATPIKGLVCRSLLVATRA